MGITSNDQIDWDKEGKQIIIIILSFIAIVIVSFKANMIFFTAVDYSTHSAIKEYISFDPSQDLLMYLSTCAVLWILAFIFIRQTTRSLVAMVIRLLLVLLFFVYLYYTVVGTMDLMKSDTYVWWMKNIALLTDCGIITVTLISITKHTLCNKMW